MDLVYTRIVCKIHHTHKVSPADRFLLTLLKYSVARMTSRSPKSSDTGVPQAEPRRRWIEQVLFWLHGPRHCLQN
jgi:hypothetical protein